MKIIVGLGNPGKKYLLTRHNAGFMLIDALAEGCSFQLKGKSLIQKAQIEGQGVLLVKPQNFMNLSGLAVREMMNFYKAHLDQLLVIQDDKDLPFGKLRFQKSRGSGGHKGIQNIHQELKSPDYCRLKMGVAPSPTEKETSPLKLQPSQETAQFVLSPFNPEEQKELPLLLKRGIKAVSCFIEKGYETAANQFNSGV